MVKICFNLARFMFKVIFFYFHASENLFLWNEEKPFSIKLEVNALANTFPLLRFFFYLCTILNSYNVGLLFLELFPFFKDQFPSPKNFKLFFSDLFSENFRKRRKGLVECGDHPKSSGVFDPRRHCHWLYCKQHLRRRHLGRKDWRVRARRKLSCHSLIQQRHASSRY